MYMQRSGAGYIFRRAIPASLYPVINKRDSISLFVPIPRLCACEEAARSDQLFDDAQAKLTQHDVPQMATISPSKGNCLGNRYQYCQISTTFKPVQ